MSMYLAIQFIITIITIITTILFTMTIDLITMSCRHFFYL